MHLSCGRVAKLCDEHAESPSPPIFAEGVSRGFEGGTFPLSRGLLGRSRLLGLPAFCSAALCCAASSVPSLLGWPWFMFKEGLSHTTSRARTPFLCLRTLKGYALLSFNCFRLTASVSLPAKGGKKNTLTLAVHFQVNNLAMRSTEMESRRCN